MTREERDRLIHDISLSDTVGQLRHNLERVASALPVADPEPVGETVPLDIMSMPISELDLSVRSDNVMDRLGIRTIGELCNHSAEELARARNFGVVSLADLVQRLSRRGLSLRPNGQRPELPPPAQTELEAAVGELLAVVDSNISTHPQFLGSIARVRAAMGRKV